MSKAKVNEKENKLDESDDLLRAKISLLIFGIFIGLPILLPFLSVLIGTCVRIFRWSSGL